MFRLLEGIGPLAPIGGAVRLFLHRKRSRLAFGWGLAGCILALASSAAGLVGAQISIASSFASDTGIDGAFEQMDIWTLARFVLLPAAGVFLVIVALADRQGRRPVGGITGGLVMIALGIGLYIAPGEEGGEHDGLVMIAGMLIETAQAALLGAGFLVLCLAAIAYRSGEDGREDPGRMAAQIGAAAWRFYSESCGDAER